MWSCLTALGGGVKYGNSWLRCTTVLLTVNIQKRSPRRRLCWIAAIAAGVLKRELLILQGPPWLNVLTAAFCCWENSKASTATQLLLLAQRGGDVAVTWVGNTETWKQPGVSSHSLRREIAKYKAEKGCKSRNPMTCVGKVTYDISSLSVAAFVYKDTVDSRLVISVKQLTDGQIAWTFLCTFTFPEEQTYWFWPCDLFLWPFL